MPFYAMYYFSMTNAKKEVLGFSFPCRLLGGIVSAALLGYMGNRFGCRIVFRLTALFALASPALALIYPYTALPARYMFFVIFFFIGFTINGTTIGYSSYLLDISPTENRPAYVGFMNTMVAPLLLSPVLGGFLIETLSYKLLFFVTFLMVLGGFFYAGRLKNYRIEEIDDVHA